MDDLDDELLALAGEEEKPQKRKRSAKKFDEMTESEPESSDFSDNLQDSDNEAFAEVKTWGPDLMGDEEDRSRLFSMNELERETILAERRRKIDLLREHRELKARIGQKLGRRSERKKDTQRQKQGKELEKLKSKRQKKAQKQWDEEDEESDNAPSLYEESPFEDDVYEEEKEIVDATFQDILKIQVKRIDLEKWVNAPFFEKTIKGCMVRIAIGSDPKTKQQVYRLAQIQGIGVYHRPYKFGKNFVNITLNISHGKSCREFLMDLASNGDITEAEWNRFQKTLIHDHIPMITSHHIQRKRLDLEKAHNYVFTNAEIDEIVKKKRAFDKMPVNSALEKIRIQQEMKLAQQEEDDTKARQLEQELSSLQERIQSSVKRDSKLEQFTSLNVRNRVMNYQQGREAEKAAILAKKNKGANDYDPFARRKTQPKHVIHNFEEEEKKEKLSSSPAKSSIKSDTSPYLLATKVEMDEDAFLDSIDISALEQEL